MFILKISWVFGPKEGSWGLSWIHSLDIRKGLIALSWGWVWG